MQRRQLLQLGFLSTALVSLCALACISHGMPPSASVSLLALKSNACLLNLSSSISASDFDGDHRSDVVTGKSEGISYRVEIRLSTQQERTSFTLNSSDPLIQLSARDVDGDNDQDLVALSATALYPLALWLNDGKGHFQRSDPRLRMPLFTSHNAAGYEGNRSRVDPVCISFNRRLAIDGSNAPPGPAQLDNVDFITAEFETSSLLFLSDHLTARGPPLLSAV